MSEICHGIKERIFCGQLEAKNDLCYNEAELEIKRKDRGEMHYTILCVGRIKEKFYSQAVLEYSKRLSRYAKTDIVEVPDERTPDGASEAQEEQIRKKEGDRLLGKLKESMYVIALDLRGKEFDSVSFAGHLGDCMLQGKSHLVFVIGGSLGLHKCVLERCDERISFSRFTFPHQLMRVILLEQIYRANRILQHEPYHK